MPGYLTLLPYTLCFLAGAVCGATTTLIILAWLIAKGTSLYIKELDHDNAPPPLA